MFRVMVVRNPPNICPFFNIFIDSASFVPAGIQKHKPQESGTSLAWYPYNPKTLSSSSSSSMKAIGAVRLSLNWSVSIEVGVA